MSLSPRPPADILAAYAAELALKWGPNVLQNPVLNRSDNFVRMMGMSALSLSDIEAKIEALVVEQNPLNLEGAALTAYAASRGVQRLTGTSSKAVVVATGQQGAVIPRGTEMTDRFGGTWSTTSDIILESSGAGCAFSSGVACSDVAGNFQLNDDELSYDNSSTPFIFAMTNGQMLEIGGEIESDQALRNRLLNRGPLANVNGTADNAKAAVLELNGVNFVRFEFVNSDCVGSGPMFVVHGGEPSQICDTLTNKSGVPCNMVGEFECQSCTDVRFQRPCPVLLCIEICVNPDCPIATNEQLRTLIVSIAGDISRQTKVKARDIANLSQDIDSVRFKIKRPVLTSCPENAPEYIDPIDGSTINFGTSNPYGLCAGVPACKNEDEFSNSVAINVWEYFIIDPSAITFKDSLPPVETCNTCDDQPLFAEPINNNAE